MIRLTRKQREGQLYVWKCTDCPGRYSPATTRQRAQALAVRHRWASKGLSDGWGPHEVSIHPYIRKSAAGLIFRLWRTFTRRAVAA